MNSKIKELQDKKAELLKEIVDILKSRDLDIEVEDIEGHTKDAGQILKALEDRGVFNKNFLRYGEALAYISENDPTLTESLEIAKGHGYKIDDVDILLLASLLAEENARKEFHEVCRDIKGLLRIIREIDKDIEIIEGKNK